MPQLLRCRLEAAVMLEGDVALPHVQASGVGDQPLQRVLVGRAIFDYILDSLLLLVEQVGVHAVLPVVILILESR